MKSLGIGFRSIRLGALAWIATFALPSVAPAAESPRPAGAATPPPALDSVLAGRSLDLRLLVRAVQERNPSIEAMRSAWRAARARADQAGALMDPMLDLATAPRSYGSATVGPAYMISLRQAFPIFGQRGLRGSTAKAEARAIGEDYRTERLNLLRETRDAYAECYHNARASEVTRELRLLVEQLRAIALAKYQAGTVSMTDVLQAEVELAMLDHQIVALERDRRVLVARINTLLRRAPTDSLPGAPADLALPFAPLRADSAIALARELRPELKSLAAERDARSAQLSLAGRARLPEFEFEVRYDRFMEESEWRPQVGVGLNLPIQLGRIGAGVREARASLSEVEARHSLRLTQIESEVAAASARAEETLHELQIVEERVVPATQRALAAARASYEANRADFLALLSTERDLSRARLTLFEVRFGYFQALSDLERAVGAPASAFPEDTQ